MLVVSESYQKYARQYEDRMPGFFSSCPNWVHLTPSPAREFCSFLLWVQWGRQTRLRGRGWGGPNSEEGTNTLVLYANLTMPHPPTE